MPTTVLHRPEGFDESVVNRLLGEERFEDGELHEDELADLWGFVKYFYDRTGSIDGMRLPRNAVSAFEELCDSVEVEKLRYDVNGETEKSPNALARSVASENAIEDSTSESTGSGVKINLERVERQREEASIPEFSVRSNDDSVTIIFQSEVSVQGDYITGTDSFGNDFKVRIDKLDESVQDLEDYSVSVEENNGITTVVLE